MRLAPVPKEFQAHLETLTQWAINSGLSVGNSFAVVLHFSALTGALFAHQREDDPGRLRRDRSGHRASPVQDTREAKDWCAAHYPDSPIKEIGPIYKPPRIMVQELG
jgi:hypothetical protein